jgi:hypothetical protein
LPLASHSDSPAFAQAVPIVGSDVTELHREFVQVPFRQVWLVPQTLPQAPQLLALVVVLMQVVPHRVGVAVGQVQTLFWQICGDVQMVPQEPQLLLLLAVLTQVVPHRVGLTVGHTQAAA